MPISHSNFSFDFNQTRIKLAAMALLLIFFLPLSIEEAAAKTFLSLDTAKDFQFGVWANAGSLSSTQTVCAVAWDDRNSGTARTYSVSVKSLTSSGTFYLYLDGIRRTSNNRRVAIRIEHADSFDNNYYEVLKENEWESQKQDGQPPGCPKGANANFRVTIDSANLADKLEGNYIGYFQQSIKDSRNTLDASGSFAVSVTIGGIAQVQISNLDSIDFGSYSGLGDLSTDESFCIYSAAQSGAYRLSVSSTGQDSNGHYVEEVSGLGRIPLTVLYAGKGAGSGTIEVTNNYVHGNGDSVSKNCSGIDNATLTLRLAESDLQGATTGKYSGRLTILVEPE